MYDPLVDRRIPSDEKIPDSYWANGQEPSDFPRLECDISTEVAIVGAGLAGLSAAYHLKKRYGIECCVVDANQPGWGASGRNGGFVLPGSGRMSFEAMIQKWGIDQTKRIFDEFQDAVATVTGFIEQGISCDKTEGGYLKLAHSEKLAKRLYQQANALADTFGDRVLQYLPEDVRTEFIRGTKQFGGIYYPSAYSVNPWKFTKGLAECARRCGVSIYGNSPVIEITQQNNQKTLVTGRGRITADKVVITTNAYGINGLFRALHNKTFPVISSILVTKPLDERQLETLSMQPGLMVMDTRPLKYYYRILPDNRLLFGGRGAIAGKHASAPKYQQALLNGLHSTFPTLRNLAIDKFWSGWVAISRDDYPRIYEVQNTNTYYSAGYCGAGLSFATHAGKRLAQLIAEPSSLPDLPFWRTPLRTFPLAPFRRPALQCYYKWLDVKSKFG